jgi:hypothetical protein
VKTEKNLGELRGDLSGLLDKSGLSLSNKTDHHPEKRTVQLADAFEDTAFKPGFETVIF